MARAKREPDRLETGIVTGLPPTEQRALNNTEGVKVPGNELMMRDLAERLLHRPYRRNAQLDDTG
jgi:hypothetical protein